MSIKSRMERRAEKDIKISHRNLGTVNKNMVSIITPKGSVALFFSYNTLVGVDGTVSKNEWSKTTGKLLNFLQPDKSRRVPHEVVEATARRKLNEIL